MTLSVADIAMLVASLAMTNAAIEAGKRVLPEPVHVQQSGVTK